MYEEVVAPFGKGANTGKETSNNILSYRLINVSDITGHNHALHLKKSRSSLRQTLRKISVSFGGACHV